MCQKIIYSDYNEIKIWLKEKQVLLVCGKSFDQLKIKKYLQDKNIIRFSDFSPNPDYKSVVKGIKIFNDNKCNAILAIGGGSAIDVAKCIKLFSGMNPSADYLQQKIKSNEVSLMAVPTTAGTGSEATRYAVIYKEGKKISVTHDSAIPDTVFFDPELLDSLPLYQRKATMLDTFGHAIESYWSVNSTDLSKEYSEKAIKLFLTNWKEFILSDKKAQENMLMASNIAGKAINITQTTAGHALSYELTTLYGISHGHAVALCISKLWSYMLKHNKNIRDERGKEYVQDTFLSLARLMGCKSAPEASDKFQNLIYELDMQYPIGKQDDIKILCESVNEERLKNNPIELKYEDINQIYSEIVKVKK